LEDAEMTELVAIQDCYADEYAHCYGCGRLNDDGLKLKSYADGDETVCRFTPDPKYSGGYPGFLYGGMIASLMPLLTLLLSSLFLREAPGLGTVCGGLLSLFGLLILIGQGHPMQLFENGVVPGDFLMLLATVAYALYGVLLSKWSLPIPSWQLLYLQTLVAVVLLVPGFVLAPSSPITAANLPLILFAGIAASILSQILWMRGVAHLGPNRATMFMNLFPVFTVIIAVVALGESLHAYHALGGGITLFGVILAQTLNQRVRKRAARS